MLGLWLLVSHQKRRNVHRLGIQSRVPGRDQKEGASKHTVFGRIRGGFDVAAGGPWGRPGALIKTAQ